MIGPLFVAAGVSAFDLLVGLLLGNLLAVLSWTFLTAPIATHARQTLYYQLEKICGRNLVTIYNLANGVMFCFLAGAMITVSATAIGVWVKFPMPGLNDVYPNSVGWVAAVLAVGTLVSLVAAYGYGFVARVANVAAPWMVLVFLAFGIVGLKQFIDATHSEIHSLGDLWTLATTHIWKGGEPLPGQAKFTLWHVMFFAWFCNMAMHIGMSDLTIFRYARHSWYGVSTSSGMYVGHFMAWISASILYALQLFKDPSSTDVLPGPMAYDACGIAGLLCVIVAGWTTANPTIYRAGLAFQAIMPRAPLQSDAGHRPDRHGGRHVSRHRDEVARLRDVVWHVVDAHGRGGVGGLLAERPLRVPVALRRAFGVRHQLGGGRDLVCDPGGMRRSRASRRRADLFCESAGLVHRCRALHPPESPVAAAP